MGFSGMVRHLARLLLLPVLCLLITGMGSAANAEPLDWTTKAPMPIAMSRGNANVVNGIMYVLGGTGAAASAVQAYDPLTDSWALLPQLPQPMFTAASAVQNEKIYMAGGYNPSGEPLAGVFWYDTVTGASQQIGTLVVPRSRFSGAIVNNRMYLVGGSGTAGTLASIEEIDLATGASVIKQNLPAPTSLAGVTAVDGKVYIFGGNASGVGVIGDSWEYDPQTNELAPLPSMPVASEFETALPYNGKIYLVSSMPWSMPNQNNLIQAYDIQNRSWEVVSSVPTTRDVPMAGIINGSLYVAGGFSAGSSNGTVNEALYLGVPNPALSWATRAPLPIAMSTGNASVVNGVMYILGGISPLTGQVLDTVQAYDPLADSWRVLPPLPGQMFTAASAVLNEKIYVAGGFSSSWEFLPGVFWYDTVTGASQQIGTLVEPRSRFSGAIVANRFYAVGGSGYNGTLSSIEEIDLASGVSIIKQYLPRPVSLAGVAAVGGKIFIFGLSYGNDGVLGESWQYDPQTNELMPLPQMPVVSEFETALPYNGKIYLVSSMPGSMSMQNNLIQAYDIQNRSWEVVSSVPTTRSVPMAGIINGTLYVAGGYVSGSSNGTVNEALSLGAAGPTMTLHSVNFDGMNTYIDWPTSQHGQLDSGSYLQINGIYYKVIYSYVDSWWSGPGYSMALLFNCDQLSGAPLDPSYPNYYPQPYLSGVVGAPMSLFAQWPLPVPADTTPPSVWMTGYSGYSGMNGWFTSDVYLYLASIDNIPGGSGVRSIEYSYDGSSWQMFPGSSLYISQQGRNTIYYRASDNAGNVSPLAAVGFNIDKTAPTTTAVLAATPGSNGWLVSPATLILSATDPVPNALATQYSLDGSSWTTYSAPVVFSADGLYAIRYRTIDEAGNVEATKTVSFKIDQAAPVATHTFDGLPGENGWYKSNVNVTLTATDAVSSLSRIEYSLNGGAWTIYGTPFVISAEGTTTVAYRATDAAGNVVTGQAAVVRIDKTAPVAAAALSGTAGENGIYTGDVQLALTAADAISGVNRLEYSLDGTTWAVYSAPVIVSAAGGTTVLYRAFDTAGLTEQPVKNVTFTIDRAAPVVVASDPLNAAANVAFNKVITVSFSENVVAGSAYNGISLKKGKTVVPVVTAVSGVTLQLTPSALLAKNTLYTVTVPAGAVKDLAGRLLAAPLNFNFTTARR